MTVLMTGKAEEILEQAMQLSESERAEVAAKLIKSVDQEADTEAERLWDEEIARRVAAVESGQAKVLSWEEVRGRMRSTRSS